MRSSRLIGAVLYLLAFNVNAEIISIDWQTPGDNLITLDKDSGLEWLDLTETNNISRQNLLPMLEPGGTLEGWRLATNAEVVDLWSNFGIDLSTSSTINGLDPNVATASSYLGNIYCEAACGQWPYGVSGLTSDSFNVGGTPNYNRLGAYQDLGLGQTHYNGDDDIFGHPDTASAIWFGHYLVRETIIPIPAAAWLFCSGLLGLIGVGRRRANA